MVVVVSCALRITSNVILMSVWIKVIVTELYHALNGVVERHLLQPRWNKLSYFTASERP
jgi:hypothetical protein